MKRLAIGVVGVDQGSVVLFSDFESGGEMWTGSGRRERRREIRFSEAFREPPAVHLALSMIDLDHGHNHRVDLSTDAVSETGFQIVFRTWGDTKVARARVDWLAIGPVESEDSWDVR
jgi:hypothetical protein